MRVSLEAVSTMGFSRLLILQEIPAALKEEIVASDRPHERRFPAKTIPAGDARVHRWQSEHRNSWRAESDAVATIREGTHPLEITAGNRSGHMQLDGFLAANEMPLGFVVPSVQQDALMLAQVFRFRRRRRDRADSPARRQGNGRSFRCAGRRWSNPAIPRSEWRRRYSPLSDRGTNSLITRSTWMRG